MPPKIKQKINQLGFGSNFQGNPRPMKECDWGWKILPLPPHPNLNFRENGGITTPNQSKFNHLRFASNFQGTFSSINNCDWSWKYRPPPPQSKLDLRQNKWGGNMYPKSAKIQLTNGNLRPINDSYRRSKKIPPQPKIFCLHFQKQKHKLKIMLC